MVDFSNNQIESRTRAKKKTLAESLEEAKAKGKLTLAETDADTNPVVNVIVDNKPKSNKTSNKSSKIKNKKIVNNQVHIQGDDFRNAKTDKHGIPININVPRNILEVAFIVKFNAAFKRHTALNILHSLEDDGIIISSKGGYVDFLWSKFRVTADGGLRKEYRYTDDLFISALVKAHGDVARDSEKALKNMIDIEDGLNKDTNDNKDDNKDN